MNNAAVTDELFEAMVRRVPAFLPEEQRAGLVLLREVARGEPVGIAQFEQALGTSIETAEALTRDSPLSRFVYADQSGRIQGFFGLSVTPTHHQTTINKRKLWAWCAPDTLEHPELLDETAQIESRDPETGEWVHLTVSRDRIETVDLPGAVLSMSRPKRWDVTSADRIITSACHFHFFFASRDSAERWVAKHPETLLLSLEEAFAFMKRFNHYMFGTELARRRADAA